MSCRQPRSGTCAVELTLWRTLAHLGSGECWIFHLREFSSGEGISRRAIVYRSESGALVNPKPLYDR